VKRKITIELFEEHDRVNYYTICFDGESSETDKFFDLFDNDDFSEDINIVVSDFDTIGNKGAYERDFRREGKSNDRLCALPSNWVSCRLRLFCLRINEQIVILGNGYEKTSQTYNENPTANYYAETLLSVDKLLRIKLSRDIVQLYNRQFYGDLSFIIEDERPKEK